LDTTATNSITLSSFLQVKMTRFLAQLPAMCTQFDSPDVLCSIQAKQQTRLVSTIQRHLDRPVSLEPSCCKPDTYALDVAGGMLLAKVV